MGRGVATAPGPTHAHALPLPELVAARARITPALPFVDEIGGESLSYGDVHARALRWAGALRGLGVGEGDTVPVLLPSTATALDVWLGLAYLGAVELPVNPDLTVALVAEVLRTTPSRTVVVGRELLGTMCDAISHTDRRPRVVVVGRIDDDAADAGCDVVSADGLLDAPLPDNERRPSAGSELSGVIWTSGTTGPSKGVLVPWAQLAAMASGTFPPEQLAPESCFYLYFPLHYVGGRMAVQLLAGAGGRVALRRRFSASSFWPDVVAHGCTHAALNPAMCYFLLSQARRPGDATSSLRDVLLAPVIPEVSEMCERFGWRWRTAYNSTETSAPIVSGWNPADVQSCGRLRPGYDACIAGPDDEPLTDGEVGELLVRSADPWTMMQGYIGEPAATVAAWRNLWLHTGDAFRRDGHGNFHFVDRLKDTIRRRGQNISAFEVEQVLAAHPEVEVCAVVAVASEWGEDEVRAVVALRHGTALDAPSLARYCTERLPRYMIPRFIDVVPELPRTTSHKVDKASVRAMPLLSSTWDSSVVPAVPGDSALTD